LLVRGSERVRVGDTVVLRMVRWSALVPRASSQVSPESCVSITGLNPRLPSSLVNVAPPVSFAGIPMGFALHGVVNLKLREREEAPDMLSGASRNFSKLTASLRFALRLVSVAW